MEKRLFIACTVDKLPVAEKIQSFLSPEYRCKLWIAETFKSGTSALESLLSEARNTDFALILLTADDRNISDQKGRKNTTIAVPRDNLIFEAGIFLSALGRQSVALCLEHPPKVKLPTDLLGQNVISFSLDRDVNSLSFQHVIRGVADQAKSQFSSSSQKSSPQYNAYWRTHS
jgi:predicted nucleotide-binding protein